MWQWGWFAGESDAVDKHNLLYGPDQLCGTQWQHEHFISHELAVKCERYHFCKCDALT